MALQTVTLDALTITDKDSFRHVALYGRLERLLLRDGYRFHVPAPGAPRADWNRVQFLNLTFWHAGEPSDLLDGRFIPADVVAHVAWHHLARKALGAGPRFSADAALLGESIASAFDLYLVGRLLGHAPDSTFLQTQVPAMAEVAESAGLPEEGFEALLQSTADDPERAFEDLRALLFDATTSLLACRDIEAAAAQLERFDGHRFAPLLHHYELSNWVLFVRAYAADALAPDPAVRAVDAALRAAPVALDWLEANWLGPDAG